MSILKELKRYPFKSNLFVKYFVLFATIFLSILLILGTTLTILVSVYTQKTNTDLLRENTIYIADTVEENLIVQDMNDSYSIEKAMLCNSMNIICTSISADIFICDVEGKVILCKENANTVPSFGKFSTCNIHSGYTIKNNILQKVYEGGYVGKTTIDKNKSYIVGYPIYSGDQIIGSVFAIRDAGVDSLALAVIRMFCISAFACLLLAFVIIAYSTRSIVTPLRQMSAAAKQFAVGDFSYRVKVKGNDEFADLANAFNDMADSLDLLESSRRSFVSNVSHELRTPMTSIGGFIDGILDGTIPKEKSDYYLNIVSGEIKRLSRLVIAMLNMSKIESGSFEMKPTNYDISDQIIHILLTFEQKIEAKQLEIIGLENLEPTYIVADTDMIYQVIYNIFDNAVKFANQNGYIKVDMVQTQSNIEVHIKNSGIGIDADELSKVFERFYKVDKSRSLDAKGAGLGLYIVKMMVEMHGGSIWAKSDDETSAEFIFTLPKTYNPIKKENK